MRYVQYFCKSAFILVKISRLAPQSVLKCIMGCDQDKKTIKFKEKKQPCNTNKGKKICMQFFQPII